MRKQLVQMVVAAAAMVVLTGTAQPAPVFQGRNASGDVDNSCTVSGPDKCAMYYYVTLDITILNDWNIGTGSTFGAKNLAETAGSTQTDFAGWFLPTGDPRQPAGDLNQYLSIWNDVGGSLEGLVAQFDGAQAGNYWSSSERVLYEPPDIYFFDPCYFDSGNGGSQGCTDNSDFLLGAVAVRPGDVAAFMPEPRTGALVMMALGTALVARRRRPT